MNKIRHLEEEKILQEEPSIVLSYLGFYSNPTPIQCTGIYMYMLMLIRGLK